MFKFIYRMRPSAERGAPTAPEASDDPFAYPEIASMSLQMLADLPPDQLRERKATRDAEGGGSSKACPPKACPW
jgi:hypothetical protein